MEPEAVSMARRLLTADDRGNFIIEDDEGKIIMTDRQIRSYCKATRMP
jgi:hypothetical protein